MAQTKTEATAPSLPYISFSTVQDLAGRMEEHGTPNRIDRSYLDNYSGGYQTQVLATLDILGLRGPGGEVTETMKALIKGDETQRQEIVRDLVRKHYAPVLALGQNATQGELMEAFGQLAPQLNGATRRKAVQFFLKAAQFSGITVSGLWKAPRVAPSGSKPKKIAGKRLSELKAEEDDDGEEEEPSKPEGSAHRIDLTSGGTMIVSISVDLFSMSKEDRDFVLEVVDKVKGYPSTATTNGRREMPKD